MLTVDQAITMCRAHRYPPATKEMAARTRGIGAHTDFGALTLLLQDEGKVATTIWRNRINDNQLGDWKYITNQRTNGIR